MNFFQINEVLTASQMDTLSNLGSYLIEDFEYGDYQIALIGSKIFDNELKLQLAIQRKDRDFTNYQQQFEKTPLMNMNTNSIEPIKEKIEEWIEKYETISIASMNPAKTIKWANIAKYLGFNPIEKHFEFHGQDITYFVLNQ